MKKTVFTLSPSEWVFKFWCVFYGDVSIIGTLYGMKL